MGVLRLSRWEDLIEPPRSGELQADVAGFLNANGKRKTAEHCAAVAKAGAELSTRFGVDQTTAITCGLLHDISAVLRPGDMLAYAEDCGWALDEAEQKHPFLLHQRISAVIANAVFGVEDPDVLSAIECHSTLRAKPSDHDLILFLADKLSWDQAGTPPFFDSVTRALNRSLAHAARVYIDYVMDNGMVLCPHQWLLDARAWLSSCGDTNP